MEELPPSPLGCPGFRKTSPTIEGLDQGWIDHCLPALCYGIWQPGGCTSLVVLQILTNRGCSRFPEISAIVADGFLREKKCLLMDRDTKFSEAFRVILEQTGVKAVRLPPRSPNLNPNLEKVHAIHQGGMLGTHNILRRESAEETLYLNS